MVCSFPLAARKYKHANKWFWSWFWDSFRWSFRIYFNEMKGMLWNVDWASSLDAKNWENIVKCWVVKVLFWRQEYWKWTMQCNVNINGNVWSFIFKNYKFSNDLPKSNYLWSQSSNTIAKNFVSQLLLIRKKHANIWS